MHRRGTILTKTVHSILLALAFVVGCKDNGAVEAFPDDGLSGPYWPTTAWRRANPEKYGLNAERLSSLIGRLRNNEIRDTHSLLVVRNGYLVVEEYFNGSSSDDIHTLQSVTKSVTSLLIGIAFTQGSISTTDQNVLAWFNFNNLQNVDSRKQALRMQDLLTMRTGLDWSESNYSISPLKQLNECGCDWLRFVLNWPMMENPGTRFQYNSGGVIVLGGILRNATDSPVDTFAERYLFSPLGILGAWWYYGQPDRLPHMGGGLNLRARDMAKIGYLVLNKGRWENRQIVSEEWIRQSTTAVTTTGNFWNRSEQYGYLWWLFPLDPANPQTNEWIITASGAGGQWIFIVPKYDLVVAITGNTQQPWQALDFFYGDILPSIR
jgi:CubicO group peptidase (beta-lactamase class C family)